MPLISTVEARDEKEWELDPWRRCELVSNLRRRLGKWWGESPSRVLTCAE